MTSGPQFWRRAFISRREIYLLAFTWAPFQRRTSSELWPWTWHVQTAQLIEFPSTEDLSLFLRVWNWKASFYRVILVTGTRTFMTNSSPGHDRSGTASRGHWLVPSLSSLNLWIRCISEKTRAFVFGDVTVGNEGKCWRFWEKSSQVRVCNTYSFLYTIFDSLDIKISKMGKDTSH